MQIKLRTGSNQALGYRKWLHLIKWAISFKMGLFLLISKSVTSVDLQSLTLCSRTECFVRCWPKAKSISGTVLAKVPSGVSLNNRCRDYFSWKVLEQLWICCQQLLYKALERIKGWMAAFFYPKATRLLKINKALQENRTQSVMKQNMVTATWLTNTHLVFEF